MTIALTGTGGLFTRLGALGYWLNSINAFRGNTNLSAASIRSVQSAVDNVQAQFATPDLNLPDGFYSQVDSYRQTQNTMTAYLRQIAQNVVCQMADNDTPLPQKTVANALAVLITQMLGAGATVKAPTVSSSMSAGSGNTGLGKLACTTLESDGLAGDYMLAENLAVTCTQDAQVSGTPGLETFGVTSPAAQSDALAWDWPKGSGVTVTVKAVDALQDNANGNLLQNGSYKTYSNANQPDNWVVDVATIGTTVLEATGSNVYKGDAGLAFVGNGSQLTGLYQPFGVTPSAVINSGGTLATLKPSTTYAVNLFLKVDVVPAAGVLKVELTNGAGTVTTDAAGNSNSISKTLSGATTSFVNLNGFFRTPAALPTSGLRLRVKLTTALSAGSILYIGHLALTPATVLYPGGPSAAVFSGTPDFVAGDTFSLTVANNYGGGFEKLFERFFGMKALGYQLPSTTGSPTISDALIA